MPLLLLDCYDQGRDRLLVLTSALVLLLVLLQVVWKPC
jgi:hypothetical protein